MRSKTLGVLALAAAALTAVAVPAGPAPAAVRAGGHIESSLPPGQQPHGYAANPAICPSGAEQCVDTTVTRMQDNLAADGCDHNATFAALYLDTTLAIRAAIRNDEFSDRPFWNQIAQTFGTYYLDSFDAWTRGEDTRVPEAWRIAFEDARTGRTSTLGDVFLGINAHVNRDLAFVYYQTGAAVLADHLHVNTVLGRAAQTAYPDIDAHLDDTIYSQLFSVPSGLDLDVYAWRDEAWANAQRLAAAPDAHARGQIAAEIEASAVARARTIEAAFPASAEADAARDAFCAAHR
jgi:hypothetical protein